MPDVKWNARDGEPDEDIPDNPVDDIIDNMFKASRGDFDTPPPKPFKIQKAKDFLKKIHVNHNTNDNGNTR